MAGLIDMVTGEIGRDSNVLFAHLGGQPALNGYSALFHCARYSSIVPVAADQHPATDDDAVARIDLDVAAVAHLDALDDQ